MTNVDIYLIIYLISDDFSDLIGNHLILNCMYNAYYSIVFNSNIFY